jgi:GTP cyclohydrolase I
MFGLVHQTLQGESEMASVGSATQVLERPLDPVALSWPDIYQRVAKLPPGRCYGVPRGGSIVAGLTGIAVHSPEMADYIVDDILDSGQTRQHYRELYPDKPFIVLVDKQAEGLLGRWVSFPWEATDGERDIQDTVTRQLEYFGEDPTRDGLLDTPRRVIKSFTELLSGYGEDPAALLSKTFDVAFDEMVVLRGIEFWSLCEHHMLPFHGTASVAYIPVKRVVGISKLARLVHCFSRRLQVQERLTQEIASAINNNLHPLGVGVLMQASHLCMALRGVKTPADMVTSCLLGTMKTDGSARAEFLSLANVK